ncbi:MAG: thioredoxin [Bacilli bacterium]|nr:thioredoxin [Bacilli bacterium]
MSIIEVNKDNFESEVLKSNTKVLVDFNAEWCGPCKMLKPILEGLSEKVDFKIVSVNVDDQDELAEQYQVSSIPCLVVFQNGTEVNRNVGFITEEDILNLVGGK